MRFSTPLKILAVLAISGSPGLIDAARGEDGIKAGMTLGQNNWKLAEGLLPPEILDHYRQGEYENPVVEWPLDFYVWPTDFKAGTDANVGKYEIGPQGQIIEVATGKQPAYIIGFPFPEIDEKDPNAASKVLWNFNYRTWYFGNSKNESQVNWVSSRKLERRMDVEASFKYYDGIPENEREENPQNLSVQFLTVVQAPTDVNGTSALSWRYLDPRKRDSSWSFVPALRRVRAVSPANRSDGFLGSDMSQDDGPFFDGKPEDFTWKLKGTVDQLRLIDPLSLQQARAGASGDNVWLDEGGWRANWPDLDFIGYMDESWEGSPWAPRTGALTLRPHWVLEGVPKDRYYLYGNIELYIDKISFQGSWNRKFSWKGEILNTLQVMAFIPAPVTRPNGEIDFVQGSNMAFQCAENIKRNQATVAGIKQDPKSGFDSHVTFGDSFFDMNTLSRYGK